MNIEDYISSGVIEDYVLGLLSQEEMQEVEKMAETYPEVRSEIHAYGQTLETVLQKQKIEVPPKHLKEKVLNAALNEDRNEIKLTPSSTPSSLLYWKIAASLFFIIACGSIILLLSDRNVSQSSSTTHETSNNTQAEDLKLQVATLEQKLHEKNVELMVAMVPTMELITLNPTSQSTGKGGVCWDTVSNKTVLDIYYLPEPEENTEYQLWYVSGEEMKFASVLEMQGTKVSGQLVDPTQNPNRFLVTSGPKGQENVPNESSTILSGEVELG